MADVQKNRVHRVLAHSYIFHFLVFLFAFSLDYIFPLKFTDESSTVSVSLGSLLLVLGTVLIVWAQISSHKLNKENITKETFMKGPYRYTRGPTNFGVFFVMFGFGIALNSLFIVIFSLISLLISRLTFIRKEEKILSEKYGESYLEYKKSVKF